MGAEQFSNYVETTADVELAFADVRDQALYDHGHSGYSGTIAEKSEFVLVGTVSSHEEAVKLAEELSDANDDRVNDKWGPAGAIAVQEDGVNVGYLFFGWASS